MVNPQRGFSKDRNRTRMFTGFLAGIHVADPILKTHTMNWFQISSIDLARRAPHEAALRNELLCLEQSHALASSPRLLQLLRYLFTETLEGRCEQISQYSIAFDCYGMGGGFDSATNTLVRSQAAGSAAGSVPNNRH